MNFAKQDDIGLLGLLDNGCQVRILPGVGSECIGQKSNCGCCQTKLQTLRSALKIRYSHARKFCTSRD